MIGVRLPFRHREKHLASVIRPQILAYIAYKNLSAKRLRTGLTSVGIVIGVGAIVFLVSLALGLHSVVDQQVIGSRSVKAIDVTSPNETVIPLDDSNLNKMRNFDHVVQVSPAFILPAKVSEGGSLTDVVLYATDNTYINLSALKFVAGDTSLKSDDDAIISTSLLSLIGQSSPQKAIGQKISITATITSPDSSTNKSYKDDLTVGGVANIGSGVAVYMSGQVLHAAGDDDYGQIKVLADNRSNVPTIRSQIAGLGLTTASPLDTLGEINNIFTIFTFVVIGFGGIGMIIAALGMFNTLTISLLERTSEIGLMITMGARKADVRRLMIFEALLLACLGGIGGIFAAWLVGFIIDIVLTHFANSHGVQGYIQTFLVTPLLVAITMCFVVIVGWLVALYPSRRAAHINPIDALRHE
jgi:putative ABC transport system permease protein